MKYHPKTRVLEFTSDENVSKFHDELTELMRSAMSMVGNADTSDDEAVRLTREFFERYSVSSDVLRHLRLHLPRGENPASRNRP